MQTRSGSGFRGALFSAVLKKLTRLFVRDQQRIRFLAQFGIAPTRPFQERRPFQRRQIARGAEDFFETLFQAGRHISRY